MIYFVLLLWQVEAAARERADKAAAMPPVLPAYEETERVLSDDSETLSMLSTSHHVFIDTSPGLDEKVGIS